MEDLIISRYTQLFSNKCNKESEYFIYNSRSNAFMKISKSIYNTLCAYQKKTTSFISSSISPDNLNVLRETKVLVHADDDNAYIREYEMKTHLNTFISTHLSLSLAPTSACNFRCPYCYEKSKPNKIMSDKTIDDLIKFINGHKLIKTVGITWYGGEPLMAFQTIRKIVEKIENECTVKLVAQEMVTNGYNFNDEIIQFCRDYDFSRIQITVDGPESEHNKTRILCNGKGTYQKIISNIERILMELPKTHIAIRVNIGKDNQDGYSILYKELTSRFSGNFSMYPGFIRISDENQTRLLCDSMEQKDVVKFYDKLEKESVIKLGYYPKLCKNNGCVATSSAAYVVGPSGELYKCWNDMGDEEQIIGYISNSKFTNPELFNKYMLDGRWTSDENCKMCFFLPICSGGCAWQRVRNKHNGGTYNFCSIYKDHGIERFLQLQYKKWKMSLQNNTN